MSHKISFLLEFDLQPTICSCRFPLDLNVSFLQKSHANTSTLSLCLYFRWLFWAFFVPKVTPTHPFRHFHHFSSGSWAILWAVISSCVLIPFHKYGKCTRSHLYETALCAVLEHWGGGLHFLLQVLHNTSPDSYSGNFSTSSNFLSILLFSVPFLEPCPSSCIVLGEVHVGFTIPVTVCPFRSISTLSSVADFCFSSLYSFLSTRILSESGSLLSLGVGSTGSSCSHILSLLSILSIKSASLL